MFLRKADNLPTGKNQGKVAVGITDSDHLIGFFWLEAAGNDQVLPVKNRNFHLVRAAIHRFVSTVEGSAAEVYTSSFVAPSTLKDSPKR
jgi:hypothetical protein